MAGRKDGVAVPVPGELLGGLTGAETDAEFKFTQEVAAALEKLAPELVPRINNHPFADAIARGVQALDDLLKDFRTNKDEMTRAAALDAIAEIIQREHATAPVVDALQKIMAGTKSQAIATTASKALACAGHEGFLEQQRNFLASDNPADVRMSAKLCGYGKYEPATEVLLLLLRPDNMAVSDAVLWAIGEIGSQDALPKLHGMLSDLIAVENVVEAVGKIGHPSSVIRLLPLAIEGSKAQREKASQAILRIARKNDGHLQDLELNKAAKATLERVIDKDDSVVARFYAIVAYSVLGGHLEPARIKAALGAKLSNAEMDSVSGFFAGEGSHRGAKKKGRKPV